MDEEIVLNYDKRININSRMHGKDILAYEIVAYGNMLCHCTKCGAEYAGYLQGSIPFGLNRDSASKMFRLYADRHKKPIEIDYFYARDELYTAIMETSCPICGNSFQENPEHTNRSYDGDKLYIRALTNKLTAEEFFESKDLVCRERLEECSSSSRISRIERNGASSIIATAAKTDAIKSDPEKLKKYILHLIQLEGNIYAIKKRLGDLYFQQSENEKYIIFCENAHNKPSAQIPYLEKQVAMYSAIIGQHKEWQERRANTPSLPPQEPRKPELRRVGFFDIGGNAEINKNLMKKYEQQMEDYRKAVDKFKEEQERNKISRAREAVEFSGAEKAVENIKAEIAERLALTRKLAGHKHTSPALVIKSMLDEEIQRAEGLLYKLAATREEFYGFDVVFGKYRNVIALSTFYEYLMAGRCTSLEGANGAYNLYESESRADLIITKLNDVIERLDKIIDNQYTIASLLNKINSQLGQLNDTMEKAEKSLSQISQNTARIAENSEVIAHNTAVSAYYSKVNAELTNSMGYLMAYKL